MEYLLKKNENVNDTYSIQCHIGQGAFGDVYRVKHKYLGTQVLKVIKPEYAEQTNLETITGEANILSQLTHENIVRVFDANKFTKNGQEYFFITMGFVSGETLAQLLKRKGALPLSMAFSIMEDILTGLAMIHANDPPIIHRDISPDNILLSYEQDRPKAMLSDFGLAQFLDYTQCMPGGAGKYIYMAPECFWNVYLPASDVFSVGILFYQMITGGHPWDYNFEDTDDPEDMISAVASARKGPIEKLSKYVDNVPSLLETTIAKALAINIENRYLNAKDFLKDISILFTRPGSSHSILSVTGTQDSDTSINSMPAEGYRVRIQGKGFDQIAGMDDIKELLYHDVIRPLQDKDLYDQYKLSIPNGMLLYGPPGCGKTFIAQKFAEEVGFTFLSVKPSDVASSYIHGTQEKIKAIFDKAREKAPSIIFIDEIDALVPSREGNLQHSYSSEVNEFLAQMSECGKDNVFLIAATNRPEKIDPAVMRTGRIDKLFYLAPPDLLARKKMFQLHLSGRPTAEIDIEQLSKITENYVASDITFLVDEAARHALRESGPIEQSHIENVIKVQKPSLSTSQLKAYEKFRESRSFN